MATTEYVPFANDPAANTQTPATYTADSQRTIGNQPGIARSEFVNTSLRQACTGVAGVAQFAVTEGTLDLPDDGDPATFAAALKNAIQALITGAQFWKPGDVKATMDSGAQTGWLELNGQFILQTSYPALYAIGVANGWATTGTGPTAAVQLPDGRAEFLRGADLGRNVDPGRTLGSAQGFAIQSHTHQIIGLRDAGSGGLDINGGTGPVDATGNTQATGGSETRPRNITVRYLIKT